MRNSQLNAGKKRVLSSELFFPKLFISYWNIADEQCCGSFRRTTKRTFEAKDTPTYCRFPILQTHMSCMVHRNSKHKENHSFRFKTHSEESGEWNILDSV